jgi:hypothetical protein
MSDAKALLLCLSNPGRFPKRLKRRKDTCCGIFSSFDMMLPT